MTAVTASSSSSDSQAETSELNTTTKKRVVTSYIWDHGSEVVCNNGSRGWKCGCCCHVVPYLSSTSNHRCHLRKKHCISDPQDGHDSDQQNFTYKSPLLHELKA